MRTDVRRRPRGRRLFWIYTEIIILLFLAIVLGVIGGTFYSVSKILPNGDDIANYKPAEATQIISSDGVVLGQISEENRETVSITDIPKNLQDATVAIEDSRFYSHLGVDFVGIGRAVYQNIRSGHMGQGGSTLTQQLARNIYLTREKKLSRKLQEVVLALELERNYSKEQILELYLNQVYYGSGSYGVQTASKMYFGKNVKDLTLAECALIAGLPQKPSGYSPYEDLKAATGRRNVVLKRMVDLGYITSEQCDRAKAEPVRLVGRKPTGLKKYKAPWFVSYVISQLTDKYGADLIYRGGLRVYTTLNYEMQQAAEEALRKGVAGAANLNVSQGAMVCIDPKTGYIKAMVGGVNPDYSKDQYNRVTQAHRQPGSSFKAFVYTAAIDNGYDANYRISNSRISYTGSGPAAWTPQNFDGRYGGTLSIKQAVARSVNICAVRMADKIGIDQVITYARMLGIKSPLNRSLALALGCSGVTPLEICSAYGVFAANGVRAEPMSIVRIAESNGNKDGAIIESNEPITHQVLSSQTAEIMNDIFRGVVTSRGGTGYNARRVPNAHGKTGTTSEDRDAWFLGYTPELVTAVWVGNDKFSTPMRKVFGGNVCAPAWSEFMLKALPIYKKEHEAQPQQTTDAVRREQRGRVENTPRQTTTDNQRTPADSGPRTVTICSESGLLATRHCPDTYQAVYEAGTEPQKYCTLHGGRSTTRENNPVEPTPNVDTPPVPAPKQRTDSTQSRRAGEYVMVTVCVDSNKIANPYCPETQTKRFRADEAPTRVCRIHKAPAD